MRITEFGTIRSDKAGIIMENFRVEDIGSEEEVSWTTMLQAIANYSTDFSKTPELIVISRDEYDKLIY